MEGAASIVWLGKGGICIVNCTGASSIWSWSIIFTLQWGQGELEQIEFALLMIIDQYQQIEQPERFAQLRRGYHMLISFK